MDRDSSDGSLRAEGTRSHPGQVVMVNQNYRWRPHVQALRQGIQAGRIGRAEFIHFLPK